MVALRHVYIDESGTDVTSPYLTIAGYVFESQQAARFSRDWSKILQKYGLPHAHMTDAVSQNGVYAHLSDAQCDVINRKLIENIKRRSLIGVSFSLEKDHFEHITKDVMGFPTAYAFAIVAVVHAIARWSENKGFGGKIAYFFEAGHKDHADANRCMQMLAELSGGKRAEYRYLSHSFFAKADAPPLQAADMLAWQVTKYIKCRSEGRSMRKDFRALLRAHDIRADLTTAGIEEIATAWADAIQNDPDYVAQ